MNSISAALGISTKFTKSIYIEKKDNHKIYTKNLKNVDGIETIQIQVIVKVTIGSCY